MAKRTNRRAKVRAIWRPLPADDPRSLDHPDGDAQADALAEALGRQIAREAFARDQAAFQRPK